MPPPEHMGWFVTHPSINTTEGRSVSVLEFAHQPDNAILAAWARHFREHYCLEADIDVLRRGTGLSRAQFLIERIFPNAENPGPAVQAGDFAEILVSDFLEYSLDHWVPRWRFSEKATPNESVKGTDIIGLRIFEGIYAGTPSTRSPPGTSAADEWQRPTAERTGNDTTRCAEHDAARPRCAYVLQPLHAHAAARRLRPGRATEWSCKDATWLLWRDGNVCCGDERA